MRLAFTVTLCGAWRKQHCQCHLDEAKCHTSVQASRLRSKLVEHKIPEEALWVTSPLTRAIDTFILACPQPQRLGSPTPPLLDAEAGSSASTQQSCPFKVVVRRSASCSVSLRSACACSSSSLFCSVLTAVGNSENEQH